MFGTKVRVQIHRGTVVIHVNGEKAKFDRGQTADLYFDLQDSPDAQTPDIEVWTAFEEFEPPREGWRIFKNNLYTVLREDNEDGGVHLSIRSNDRHWRHDWRHLQRIKNEILGPEREAIELYPAESRLMDEANQFHLWALPAELGRIPIGYDERYVNDAAPFGSAHKQRALVDEPAPVNGRSEGTLP